MQAFNGVREVARQVGAEELGGYRGERRIRIHHQSEMADMFPGRSGS